eukprot:6195227-Pleurochrysis_carterae.AAC.5
MVHTRMTRKNAVVVIYDSEGKIKSGYVAFVAGRVMSAFVACSGYAVIFGAEFSFGSSHLSAAIACGVSDFGGPTCKTSRTRHKIKIRQTNVFALSYQCRGHYCSCSKEEQAVSEVGLSSSSAKQYRGRQAVQCCNTPCSSCRAHAPTEAWPPTWRQGADRKRALAPA